MHVARENMLKELKIQELIAEIMESGNDIRTDIWIDKMVNDIGNYNDQQWFNEQVLFRNLSVSEKEAIEYIVNITKNFDEKLEIIFCEISFSSTREITYDLILEGKGVYINPVKIIFDGSFIEEYLTFEYNEEDHIVDIKNYDMDNSWYADEYLPKEIKESVKKLLELTKENPLQVPINPKEIVKNILTSKFDPKFLALIRIEFLRLFRNDSKLKKLFEKNLDTKNYFGIGLCYTFIRELSNGVFYISQKINPSRLYKKVNGGGGIEMNKIMGPGSSYKFYKIEDYDKLFIMLDTIKEAAKKAGLDENKINDADLLLNTLMDLIFLSENSMGEKSKNKKEFGVTFKDETKDLLEKLGVPLDTFEQIVPMLVDSEMGENISDEKNIKIKAFKLDDLLKMIEDIQNKEKE